MTTVYKKVVTETKSDDLRKFVAEKKEIPSPNPNPNANPNPNPNPRRSSTRSTPPCSCTKRSLARCEG